MVLAVNPAVPPARFLAGVRVGELLGAGYRRVRSAPILWLRPGTVPEGQRNNQTRPAAVTVLWRRTADPGRAAALAELLFRAAEIELDHEDARAG